MIVGMVYTHRYLGHPTLRKQKETKQMRFEKVYVRARMPNGLWDSVDAMLLTDDSFRAAVLDWLIKAGVVVAVKDEYSGGEIDLEVDRERLKRTQQ